MSAYKGRGPRDYKPKPMTLKYLAFVLSCTVANLKSCLDTTSSLGSRVRDLVFVTLNSVIYNTPRECLRTLEGKYGNVQYQWRRSSVNPNTRPLFGRSVFDPGKALPGF